MCIRDSSSLGSEYALFESGGLGYNMTILAERMVANFLDSEDIPFTASSSNPLPSSPPIDCGELIWSNTDAKCFTMSEWCEMQGIFAVSPDGNSCATCFKTNGGQMDICHGSYDDAVDAYANYGCGPGRFNYDYVVCEYPDFSTNPITWYHNEWQRGITEALPDPNY